MSGEFYIATVSIIFSLGVLPLGILYFIHRVKAKKLDSIIKVVELGGNVDPEMMKILSTSSVSYRTDYRYGLIWIAIGIPLFAGILIESGVGEAVFGSIPLLIGIAYLISGKLKLREAD